MNLTFEQMAAAQSPDAGWIWDGYLKPRCVTLLTAIWKSGKTTLLAHLLQHMREGGLFLGKAVKPARTLILSEESPLFWHQRLRDLPMDSRTRLVTNAFEGKPPLEDHAYWRRNAVAAFAPEGADLVVVDTIAGVLPMRSESEAGCVGAAADWLRFASSAGAAVLAMHHPKKGAVKPGRAARGSGLFASSADIVLEMAYLDPNASDDRRRRLTGLSRFPDTPPRVLFEWQPERHDYSLLDNNDDPAFDDIWCLVAEILRDASEPLSVADILARWREGITCPHRVTLSRRLSRSAAAGLLVASGHGTRSDPVRYRLLEA